MGTVQDLLRVFLTEYAATVVGMIALVTLITGWINNALSINTTKVIGKFLTVGHIVSWIVSIVASLIVWWVGGITTSMFDGLTASTVVLYGFIIGLGANSFFSIPLVQSLLDAIKALSPPQVEERLKSG